MGRPATVLIDSFQRGADAVIEAQKSFLNMASQPFVGQRQDLVVSESGRDSCPRMPPRSKNTGADFFLWWSQVYRRAERES